MPEKPHMPALQNTGNPVLDSLVNLFIGSGKFPANKADGHEPRHLTMDELHTKLLELYAKEPKPGPRAI